MATLDEFNEQNQDGTIINPNTARRNSVAENAANAGYRNMPQSSASEQRKIDPVKDLGLKSDEEVAESMMGVDDISQALGDDLFAAAERKKQEMQAFSDALDDCGGEMSEEDLNMITEQPDFLAMLDNPPDPLNKDLRQFRDEQIKRVRETATPEELAAMGLTPHESMSNIPESRPVAAPEPIREKPAEQNMVDEDEELLKDMEDEPSFTPETAANVSQMLEVNPNTNNTVEEEANNVIPIVTDHVTDHVTTPTVDEEEHFDDNPGEDIANKAMTVPQSDITDIDLDKELAELDEEDSETDTQKIYREKLKNAGKEIKEKVIPIANKLDIRGFSISREPISINSSVRMAKANHVEKTARWALFSTKVPVVWSEMSGPEIDELVRVSQGQNFTVTDLMKRYTLFYDHLLSPKPADVEAWLKVVSVMDIKHFYGGIYKASFDGRNFLPRDCVNERCNNGFITDSIPFEEMIHYENTEAKKKALAIYNSEPGEAAYKLYHGELVPISETYAMSFKEPSIWDAQIAPLYLDPAWYQKMESTIAINTYVGEIFVIDAANKSLKRLNIKEYRGNIQKTLKSRVLALAKVISTLTSDQYNLISTYIDEINKPSNYVEYQFPEVVCPKCKTKIEASDTTAANLLFTRHRLTSLANG